MGGAPELTADTEVVVVGAGPVGLALALELAGFGVRSIVLEAADEHVPQGSKTMVFAGHTFDTLARLGCTECRERAVVLDRARTYYRDAELFSIDFPRIGPDETSRFANLWGALTRSRGDWVGSDP